ncbi:MAG: serine hydrolase [Bacteroidetes bacterium]|nr:serine hydrolase [Bacteroidota bacterium]
MRSALTKKVSLFYLILFATFCSVVSVLITERVLGKSSYERVSPDPNQSNNCGFYIKRLDSDSLVKPILFVENGCEAENLQILKSDISNIISAHTADGTLTSSSVYLRSFLNSDWICINDSESYLPGSLLKVPILVTYLKMNENNPGFLDRKITYSHLYKTDTKANILSKSIRFGQQYSIRELLRYMIEFSDNNATYMLNENIDSKVFRKVFSDLGLAAPDTKTSVYPINAADYSKFMRALFNASYLGMEESEFAIELLSKSDFKGGILQGVPSGLRVAHKFGEAGNIQDQQLHESAIVYLKGAPYVLTIMTKGKDLARQGKVLGEISARVYQALSAKAKS